MLNGVETPILCYGAANVILYHHSRDVPWTLSQAQKLVVRHCGFQRDIKVCRKSLQLFILTTLNAMLVLDLQSTTIQYRVDFSFSDIGCCKSLSMTPYGDEIVLVTNKYYKTFWVPPSMQKLTLVTLAARTVLGAFSKEDIKMFDIPKTLKMKLMLDIL